MSAQGWTAVPHSVARSSNLSMVAKVVYLAIASRADGTGVAWPSRKTIAADAGVSLPSVERALPELREAGLLSWEQTVSASGIPHGTSRDRITAGAPLTDVPLPPAEVPVPLTDVPPTSHRGTGASHRGTEEQPIRTPKKNMSAHAHDAHPDAHFDAFWDAYPRKVGKEIGRASCRERVF